MDTEKILHIFGETVKEKRNKLNISQEKFAESCGIHRTYISQIERGLKGTSLRVLFSIANNLNMEPSELLKDVEIKLKKG